MNTSVDEIGPSIYRLSTFVSEIGPSGFTFNQFSLTMTSRSCFTLDTARCSHP